MKIPIISATMVLSSLQIKLDPIKFEQSFQTVTSSSLSWLDKEVDNELTIVIKTTTIKKTRLSPAITLTKDSITKEVTVDGEENSVNQNINNNNNNNEPLLHTNITNITTIVQNIEQVRNVIIAKALIRRLVYKCLDKYSTISSPSEVEEALKYHILPKDLQDELVVKYGASSTLCNSIDGQHQSPPPHPHPLHTWFDAIQQLREYCRRCMVNSNNEDNSSRSGNNNDESSFQSKLWECILDHPITAYVPVQCQSCGYIIPDEYSSSSTSSSLDASIGLTEENPLPDEKPFVRTGWFRGPRLKPKVFIVNCPSCNHVSRWYRSRHPKIILNPNKWGRLCGEQEDLKLDLANYLGIVRTRTILPLDWDHIWSEYTAINNDNNSIDNNNDDDNDADDCDGGDLSLSSSLIWNLRRNDDERNFIVRLDEGIGSFTRIFAISPHPSDCGDVTDSYLQCQSEEEKEESSSSGNRGHGHVDNHFFTNDNGKKMDRYREQILTARNDHTGSTTQSNTVIGYTIQRANLTTTEITNEIQNAVKDYNQYYSQQESDNYDDDKECDCESGSTTIKRAWYDIKLD